MEYSFFQFAVKVLVQLCIRKIRQSWWKQSVGFQFWCVTLNWICLSSTFPGWTILWWVYMQAMWCTRAQYHVGLVMMRTVTTRAREIQTFCNDNLTKRIPPTWDIVNLVGNFMICKCNSNLFPFCYGLFVDFFCVDCVGANSALTGNSYPLVTRTGRIWYTISRSSYYRFPEYQCNKIKACKLSRGATRQTEKISEF